MIRSTRRLAVAISAIAALLVVAAACGSSAPGTSGELSPTTAASTAPGVGPTASPTPIAIVTPATTPVPTSAPTPVPSSSAAADCPVVPSEGQVPSDRLVDLRVSSSTTADRVTFIFGAPSLGGAAGSARGSLQVAVPPFTQGDMPFEVRGERFLSVAFTGMSISNDVGQEVYEGPHDVEPDLTALRHVVMPGPFEGIIAFYIGYDGPGCVELDRQGTDVTLTIQRP